MQSYMFTIQCIQNPEIPMHTHTTLSHNQPQAHRCLDTCMHSLHNLQALEWMSDRSPGVAHRSVSGGSLLDLMVIPTSRGMRPLTAVLCATCIHEYFMHVYGFFYACACVCVCFVHVHVCMYVCVACVVCACLPPHHVGTPTTICMSSNAVSMVHHHGATKTPPQTSSTHKNSKTLPGTAPHATTWVQHRGWGQD